MERANLAEERATRAVLEKLAAERRRDQEVEFELSLKEEEVKVKSWEYPLERLSGSPLEALHVLSLFAKAPQTEYSTAHCDCITQNSVYDVPEFLDSYSFQIPASRLDLAASLCRLGWRMQTGWERHSMRWKRRRGRRWQI